MWWTRVECQQIRIDSISFFGCPDNTVCVEFVEVPVDDEVLLVLPCATNENKVSWNSKAPSPSMKDGPGHEQCNELQPVD